MKPSILICVIWLAGCVSVPSALQFRNQPKVQIQPDKALVFIYRYQRQFSLCAGDIKIYDGAKLIGTVPCASYIYLLLTPGKHDLRASEDLSMTDSDFLHAGEAYYLKAMFSCNVFSVCSEKLISEDSDTAEDEMAKLQLVGAPTSPIAP